MNKWLPTMIILIISFSFPTAGLAKLNSILDLEQEAKRYKTFLVSEKKHITKLKEGELLLSAANILQAENECRQALTLYTKAIQHGVIPDFTIWKSTTDSAMCSKNWEIASQAGFLASKTAKDEQQRIEILKDLAHTLEKRTSYYSDWRPAAISIYQELLTIQHSESIEAKIASLTPPPSRKQGISVRDTYTINSGKRPSICLKFTERFAKDNDVNLSDYIRITPAITSEFTISGNEVCINGADYGTEYSIQLLAGLPVHDEASIENNENLHVTTKHRTPALWFNQNAYVLPKFSSSGIAVHTINVDKVNLQLYRVHERNILNDFVQSKFRKKLDEYDLDKIKNRAGELVWQGNTDITVKQNKHQTNSIILPENIINTPGLYILAAESAKSNNDKWSYRVSQWLVVSDTGLTTYTNKTGLTVTARSLATAQPLDGVKLTVFARNNQPLATKYSSKEGLVRFPQSLFQTKGGMEPVLLVADDSKRGFAFLQLDRAPFDLSDRGVSGRPAPGPADAYVFSERDLYRPGETVNLVALMRDEHGRGIDSPPTTLRLIAPDGKVVLERILRQDESGSFITAVELADSARTGDWNANLYLDIEEKPVGSFKFQVKAFIPPRLQVETASQDILLKNSNVSLLVQADYLYGSPGSDLQVEGEMKLVTDHHPFADFTEYSFGIDGYNPNSPTIELDSAITDETGEAHLLCSLPQDLTTAQPLKAVVTASVFDVDGRVVDARTTIPVRQVNQYIGVKTLFSGQRVKADSEAGFQIIALNAEGIPRTTSGLSYRFIEEEIDYQWFLKNQQWGYERIVNDIEIDAGMLNSTNSPVPLALPVTNGNYRLEIFDAETTLLASKKFTAGQQKTGQSDTPDAVQVTLNKRQYQPGETARVQITAPWLGEGSLVMAGSHIHSIHNFSPSGLTHSLEIPIEKGWGSGVYAVVTVYKPGAGNLKGADRAIGLVWIAIDPVKQKLDVILDAPDKVSPRQTITIPVHVSGVKPGEKVNMTLAAVDEGVLRMTGFNSPDPLNHFFAKQQLATEIRDFYGQLITGSDNKPLSLRSGAGDMSRRGAAESNIRVVSLFSGAVTVNDDGHAEIPLELPDFNGQLRLMAVAWSKTKMGAVNQKLTVADPVVVSPSLPRFLAVEDRSTMHVLVENIDGPVGEYRVQCSGSGAVNIAGPTSVSLTLDNGQRQSILFPIAAHYPGKGSLNLKVEGPQGYGYEGNFALNVRGQYLPLLTRKFAKLAPGKELHIDKSMLIGLYPQSTKINIGISSSPNIDVKGLLEQLDRYPYGCLEQLTSRAMPLLYVNTIAERWSYPVDKNIAKRIQGGIDKILQKQRHDGSFGLWSNNSPAEPWLTSYAMEFLSRALVEGYEVPEFFFNKGVNWLTSLINETRQPNKEDFLAVTYAHYILARIGKGKPEDARYLFDNYLDSSSAPLAIAHLSAALALQGDVERALKGFAKAFTHQDTNDLWKSYGSKTRDLAGIINVSHESLAGAIDPAPVWETLTRLLNNNRYLSTQEQAWLVMASLTLDATSPMKLSVNGQAMKDNRDYISLNMSDENHRTKTIQNIGDAALWVSTTIQGVPIFAPEPETSGFTLRREWYSKDGETLDFKAPFKQGDIVIAVLEGEVAAAADYRALVIDLLPAGFEIEADSVHRELEYRYSWLNALDEPSFADALDDRFVAAFKTKELNKTSEKETKRIFRIGYVMRCVIPGSYTVPPAEVEDMYQPGYRARTEVKSIRIDE